MWTLFNKMVFVTLVFFLYITLLYWSYSGLGLLSLKITCENNWCLFSYRSDTSPVLCCMHLISAEIYHLQHISVQTHIHR